MDSKISGYKRQFDLLEKRKDSMLSALETYDMSVLRHKDNEDTWSCMQVIDHLISAESGSIAYVKKKIQAGDNLTGAPLLSRLRIKFFYVLLKSPIKFKAPSVVRSPKNIDDLSDARERWDTVRASLWTFVSQYPDRFSKKGIYRHPTAGRITLHDMLKFFEMHMIHHEHQLNRLLAGKAGSS